MLHKKEQIIEAALHCFAQKGYHATSIQEIVDQLGIAKGSIYFYFKSKEDLLFSAIKHTAEQMQQAVIGVGDNPDMSPKQRFEKQLQAQFAKSVEHRDFIIMLMTEHALQIKEEMKGFILDLRATSIRWLRESVVAIYGPEAELYSWDAASVMIAMINEYTGYMVFHGSKLDPKVTTRHMMDRMDDVVEGMIRRKQPPLLNMEMSLQLLDGIREEACSDHVADIITSIRSYIAEHEGFTQRQKEEGASYVLVLDNEIQKSDPEPVIINRMLAYLRGYQEKKLNGMLEQLETLYPKSESE